MSDRRDNQPGPGASRMAGGIARGVAICAALGVVMDNLALGIAIGAGTQS